MCQEPPQVGFAVLYLWRVAGGQEPGFRDAWKRLTRAIAAERGGLGSRLHQLRNGWFAAYAQWPSRELWARSQGLPPPASGAEAAAAMGKAIVERAEPMELDVLDDLLGDQVWSQG
ncbi:MAG: antibiotic biosynthesis monooxygenase [Planctomycetota bacterium]